MVVNDHEILSQTINKVSSQFPIDSSDAHELTRSLLIERLKKAINHLLDSDFNHLLTILYRIDIKEEKVKQILSSSPPHEMAEQLAEEIVKREEQKIISRKQHRA